jgi:hypothetical protein
MSFPCSRVRQNEHREQLRREIADTSRLIEARQEASTDLALILALRRHNAKRAAIEFRRTGKLPPWLTPPIAPG